LLHEVIIQQPVCELIDRAACVCRECFEPDPPQQSTATMMALEARLTALAAFQPGHLFAVTVPRRHLPAVATRLLCGRGGRLRQGVGHAVVRAVGRHHNPAQLHCGLFGNAGALDPFAVRQCRCGPGSHGHTLGWLLAAGVIHLPVVLAGAGGDLVAPLDAQQAVLGGVPRVHPHRLQGKWCVGDDVGQPLTDVIALALAVALGGREAVSNPPAQGESRVDVDPGHTPAPLADLRGVPAVWVPYALDGTRGVLVQHRVIKQDVAIRSQHALGAHVLPDQSGGDLLPAHRAVDGVMAARRTMIRTVRQRGGDLPDQKVLAVIETRHRCLHAANSTAFSRSWRLSQSLLRKS
jgi:hypothetical protein